MRKSLNRFQIGGIAHRQFAMSFAFELTSGQCGEGELVGGVHTLLGGVVQIYHRLHVVEEEEKGRKVEQEVEKESQGEENAHMDDYVDEVTSANMSSLSHGACADEDTTRLPENCARRSFDVVSGMRIVRCHASMDVVIGVRIVLCYPLNDNSTFVTFYFVPKFSSLSCCSNSS